MDLLQMRYVTTIAKLGNMTRAAEALHVSQSALSLSCKRLEEELGVKLFARQGRHLKLTETGVMFCQSAGEILQLTDALEQQLRQSRHSGAVTFGSEVIDFSNEMITLYRQYAPEIDASADSAPRPGLLEKLHSGEYAFALTLEDYSGDAVESTLLLDEPMLLLVGPTSHLKDAPIVQMSQLADAPLVTTSEEYSIGVLMRSFFRQAGIKHGRLHQVGDSDSITVKVYNNFGVSFVPESVVNLWIRTPLIRIQGNRWIPIAGDCCRRKIYLTRLRDAPAGAACWDLLAFLQGYSAAVRETHVYPTLDEALSYL